MHRANGKVARCVGSGTGNGRVNHCIAGRQCESRHRPRQRETNVTGHPGRLSREPGAEQLPGSDPSAAAAPSRKAAKPMPCSGLRIPPPTPSSVVRQITHTSTPKARCTRTAGILLGHRDWQIQMRLRPSFVRLEKEVSSDQTPWSSQLSENNERRKRSIFLRIQMTHS